MSFMSSSPCPVCAATDTILFDRRENVPVLQNRLYGTAEEASHARTGTLAMTGCNACGFVWNQAFDTDRIVYDGEYENDQASSPAFRDHLKQVASRVIRGDDSVALLEVGCGQGDFMARIRDIAGARFVGAVGFDPAWRGGALPPACTIVPRLFGPLEARRLPFVPTRVVSRHTIEHVPDPAAFTKAMASVAQAGQAMPFFVETPCVRWIIEHRQVQDFFYEHCSLFTRHSLKLVLERAGLAVQTVEHVFGGQYLLAIAEFAPQALPLSEPREKAPSFAAWQVAKEQFVTHWSGWVSDQASSRPVYLWGAGAKGVTFALLIQDHAPELAGLIDVNPAKQSHFTALTALPIRAPDALPDNAAVIIMNPNYETEIRAALQAQGHSGPCMCLK